MSLQWHYINLQGQEFGPFDGAQMKMWHDQNFFAPATETLLVRLPHWTTHKRISDIYGGHTAAYYISPPPGEAAAPQPAMPPPAFAPPGYPPPGAMALWAPPPGPWGPPPPGAMPFPPHPHPMPWGAPPPGAFPPPMAGYPPPPFGAYGMPPVDPYSSRRRSRSRSRSRSFSPSAPRRQRNNNNNHNKQNNQQQKKEDAEDAWRALGRDGILKLLTGAVESLYADRIRPMGLYVRGRLKERGGTEGVHRGYLDLAKRFPEVFNVLTAPPGSQADDSVVELITPPSWFEGWVDIDDQTDDYEESMWQQFEAYLKAGHQFAGGRYGMAREIHKQSLPFLQKFCLGKVCQIVQLAITKRKLVVYHKKLLKTIEQATNGISETRVGKGGKEFKNVADLDELCVVMCRLCMRRGNSSLRLEQLRNMMQNEHGVSVCEMDFKCTKLSEVMKLAPIIDAFSLSSESASLRLTLKDQAEFTEHVRQLHSRAVVAERDRDTTADRDNARNRSRSRSP